MTTVPLLERLICPQCPNGCVLSVERKEDASLQVKGHQCHKGLIFAAGPQALAREPDARYPREVLCAVAQRWGISLAEARPFLFIQGSPERTLFRTVIEDRNGHLFILEHVPARAVKIKENITRVLQYLSDAGVPFIQPYLPDAQGSCIQQIDGRYWQAIPFIDGVPLERERYVFEGWRGEALARFLIALKEGSAGIPVQEAPRAGFSLKDYIEKLFHQVRIFEPGIVARLSRVLSFLDRSFLPGLDALPRVFCHGDYHPLNVIWASEGLRSVIDWEFSGDKPEIYDAANMVGCLGMEDPESLSGDLVKGFIAALRKAGVFQDASWGRFLGSVVALRFAWLSEWLRKSDREMIDLELVYMELLMQRAETLKNVWELG